MILEEVDVRARWREQEEERTYADDTVDPTARGDDLSPIFVFAP